jgi:transposase InsO family protein
MYRRQRNGKHQIVVPKTLIQDVIRENHDPVYVAHPGTRRTYDLISLTYWWSGMRGSIEEYVKQCDACQRRKSIVKFRAPLGDVQEPNSPFEITAMDLTDPYVITPRKNRYLLTFIDHFTRYVEAFPIPDMTAETCARVYVTQIITRHGTGSQLITDQGSAFMSKFFQETCRILGVRRTRTTSLHPDANGCIARFHRTLHTGLSHYVNSTHNNWDVLVPLYLMAHRAAPSSITGYSPFYLLHGREMTLPSNDNLQARVTAENVDHQQRLENLKSALKLA